MEGFIFTCNRDTYRECLRRKIFGLPSRCLGEVADIQPTTPLFLFNVSTKELLCGFEASGYGAKNICAPAFRGRFPAQVRVNIKAKPVPLTSAQYRSAGLDEQQTGKLKQRVGTHQVQELLTLAGLGPDGLNSKEEKQIDSSMRLDSGQEMNNGRRTREPAREPTKKARVESPRPDARAEDNKPKPAQEFSESIDLHSSGQAWIGSDRTTAESGNPIEDDADARGESGASAVLGECIGSEAVLNWGWKGETRTTVAVHPLPGSSTLSVRSIINLLDVCSRDCYRFLYVIEHMDVGRVLHIDFLSVADVMKFRCGVAGRTWKDLTNNQCLAEEKIIVRFWDKCQGLEKLKEAFKDTLYLHVGEPYCCPKLADGIPIFFMQIPRRDPPAAGNITDRLQVSSESQKQSTSGKMESHTQTSEPIVCGPHILVNKFDFASLYRKLGKGSTAESEIEEELRQSIIQDIAQLKNIRQVLRNRYDPQSILPEDGAPLFKNSLEIVDKEICNQEEEMSDLDILE